MGKVISFIKEDVDSMFDIFEVATTLLALCGEMTHKKLQKLCYYVYAWNIALLDEPILRAEFQGWVHGPVCPELFQRYKGMYTVKTSEQIPDRVMKSEEMMLLINQIIRIYGNLDGESLENLTHQEEPWQASRIGLQPWQGGKVVLSDSIIRRYYLKELEGDIDNV